MNAKLIGVAVALAVLGSTNVFGGQPFGRDSVYATPGATYSSKSSQVPRVSRDSVGRSTQPLLVHARAGLGADGAWSASPGQKPCPDVRARHERSTHSTFERLNARARLRSNRSRLAAVRLQSSHRLKAASA
jgi:hypothetical protein